MAVVIRMVLLESIDLLRGVVVKKGQPELPATLPLSHSINPSSRDGSIFIFFYSPTMYRPAP